MGLNKRTQWQEKLTKELRELVEPAERINKLMQRYPDQDKLMEQLRQDIIEVLRALILDHMRGIL